MKISVIIPTYNEERHIGECLSSLLGQSYKDLEIIVVDDGSSDDTLSVITRIKNQESRIKILKQQHKVPGEARNLGVGKAKGKILVFVDADMTFDKDFINKLIDPIAKGKTKGTFSKEEYVSNWENVWARCMNINEKWEPKRRHPKRYPDKQKVFRAILKSEFDSVEGFDKGGHYNDDWSLSDKLGYKAIVAPGAKFYHKNPDTLAEVFSHALWVSKRKYKFGKFGALYALLRVSFPESLMVGGLKALRHKEPAFLVYKIVADFGAFLGIIQYVLSGKANVRS